MSEAHRTDPSRGPLPGVPSLPAARATLAQAARAADTMEDLSGRVAVRAAIAGLRYRAGDGPGAARMMALALDGARELPEPAVRAAALGGIAQAQAETGEREGAQATIAEAVAAISFGASAEDLFRTSHAHPTLAEAIKEAALAVHGRAVHL